MHLDKLEINGFKSFAKPISFQFYPKTITAIVGPNGSGKSNVIDAIKWVLGEQSAKSLRSQSSKDILFTSPKFKNINLAEVNLHFNNESQRFPLEYNNIELSRRFHRAGDSEYRLNKNQIKVSDLHYLLAQANIGQKSFSIVDQGTIHQLLHFNKEELQNFFADATGIKAYKMQLQKTSREIKKTKEQEIYINNILNEMLPRLKLLEREVKKAEQKKMVEEKLATFKYQNALHRYKKYTNELKRIQENVKAYKEKEIDLKKKIENGQKELKELTEILSNEKFLKLNQEYQELLRKRQDSYDDMSDNKVTTIPNLDAKIDILKNDIEDFKEKKIELEKILKQYKDVNIQQYLPNNVDKFIKDWKSQSSEILGFIKDLFQCDEEYLLAIESVLGGRLNGLVVENEGMAIGIVKKLRERKLGILSVYPLTKIRRYNTFQHLDEILSNYPGTELLTDVIQHDNDLQELFTFLLGNTVLAPDLETAKEIYNNYKVRLVTLKGDIFETSGIIKGGYKTFKYLSKNILQKLQNAHREFNELGLKLTKAETELKYYESLSKKDDNKKENKTAKNDIQKINARLKFIEKEVKEFTNQYQDAQENFSKQQQEVNLLNEEYNKLKNLLFNLENQITGVKEKIENLNVEEKELKNIDETIDLELIETKIMRYNARLMSIGDIDPEIQAEAEKVQGRYTELNTQQEELIKTANNLRTIVEQLKNKIRKQFKQKLREINKTFNQYFQTLFKGGSAKLQGDIIDGEIVVNIQPNIPGKKVKTFHLFSGGEKTLISTALILAIVHNQKTPFVILDEIDAALDEMNSQQLASILKDINEVTQVILVTHNKLIMQVADIMYGVTMQPAGFSDVYSLQL